MHSDMCKELFVLGAVCFAAAGCARADNKKTPAKDPVRAELSASAKEYVQGQPIRLTLVLTNRRNTPLRFERITLGTWEPPYLYLSTDGNAFSPCEPEPPKEALKRGRAYDTLQPGGSITYRFRALYGWKSENSLALIQAGRLWIQVRCPLTEVSADRPHERIGWWQARSNAIEVQIREATGVDATVWNVLRGERLLRFLQSDQAYDVRTLREAFELAKAHPTSTYQADLKASLFAYYRNVSAYPMGQVQANPELKALLEDLRKWPGITKPEDLPFPDDKRLSAKFTYTSDDAVSMPEICKQVSRLTKVPFSVAPDFANRVMYGGWQEREIRGFMRELASEKEHWIRDGDGYKLVFKPPEKAKPADSPQ